MKKTITTIALALVALCALAQSPKNIYSKYSDEKGVSAVYISPAMFRLIGRIPDIEMGGGEVDLAPIIKSLSGMYILDCENAKVADRLLADVKKYIGSGDYELLMEAREDGQLFRMYTVGDEKVVKSFVLISSEPGATSFISFEGEIPREKLEEAVAGASSRD